MESSLGYFETTLPTVDLYNDSQSRTSSVLGNLSDSINETDTNVLSYNILNQTLDPSLEFLRFLFLGVGICFICVLGIIGNILSIFVLSNRRMRSSISCLLLGLAICDLIILCNSILVVGLPTIILYYKRIIEEDNDSSAPAESNKFGHLVPYIYSVGMTALTGTIYFTMAVTLERYFAVCQPFLARRICTWNRASVFAFGIFAFSTLYNLPRFWEFACAPNELDLSDNSTNSIMDGCFPVPTELRNNPIFELFYVHILFLLTHYCIPTCALIIINGMIYLKIREADKNRRLMSPSESKENSLAYMLFFVVAVFILCNTLMPVHALWKAIKGNDPPAAVQFLKIFLLILNSSVNFAIYCTYGGKFREVFLDLLPQCCCKKVNRQRQGSDLSNCSRKSESGSYNPKNRFNTSVKTLTEEV